MAVRPVRRAWLLDRGAVGRLRAPAEHFLARSKTLAAAARLRPHRRGFAEAVLRAYAYQCAMCGFDGALGRYPVGIEAAHVRE